MQDKALDRLSQELRIWAAGQGWNREALFAVKPNGEQIGPMIEGGEASVPNPNYIFQHGGCATVHCHPDMSVDGYEKGDRMPHSDQDIAVSALAQQTQSRVVTRAGVWTLKRGESGPFWGIVPDKLGINSPDSLFTEVRRVWVLTNFIGPAIELRLYDEFRERLEDKALWAIHAPKAITQIAQEYGWEFTWTPWQS
jgi:hypothetical protein